MWEDEQKTGFIRGWDPLRETEAEDQPRQNRGAGQNILRAFLFALEAMLYFEHIHILDGRLPTY